jgi:hypothetical protein
MQDFNVDGAGGQSPPQTPQSPPPGGTPPAATPPAAEALATDIRIKRGRGVPAGLLLTGAFVMNGQLVYLFISPNPGEWFEHNYTNGTWHRYSID